MTKLNSTTAILSDLDGVILDLNYDMRFWKDWLPDTLALETGKSSAEVKGDIKSMMGEQEASLNWYDLNYWDELLGIDSLEIIKNQEERCSFLKGSEEALKKIGRYAGMTALGTFMILSPKKAQAQSIPPTPGGFGF